MVNSLQTNFNIDKNTYIMPTATTPEPKPTPIENNTAEKKSNKNKLIAALSGLAVLGGTVVWLTTRRSKPTTNEIPEVVQESVSELTTNIKENYLNAVKERLGDIGKIKELRKQISELEVKNELEKARLTGVRNKKTGQLRQKLTDLQGDEQWGVLRKLRKNLIKTCHGKASKDEKIIAQNKVSIINDLLLIKSYPEEAEGFANLYHIDTNSAYKLVTKDFSTAGEYKQAFKEAQTLDCDGMPITERLFNHTRELQLQDIFPDEIRSYVVCNEKIKNLDGEVTKLKTTLNGYMQTLQEIAAEFRTRK